MSAGTGSVGQFPCSLIFFVTNEKLLNISFLEVRIVRETTNPPWEEKNEEWREGYVMLCPSETETENVLGIQVLMLHRKLQMLLHLRMCKERMESATGQCIC